MKQVEWNGRQCRANTAVCSVLRPAVSADRVLIAVMTSEPGSGENWKLVAFETASGQRVWEFSPDPAQFGRIRAAEMIGQNLLSTEDRVYVAVMAH